MISVSEAHKIISENCQALGVIIISIEDAFGYSTSSDIYSDVDLPHFDQSAMDGYAFLFQDFEKKQEIEIISEIPAGFDYSSEIVSGFGVRIFTGAKIPKGVDTIVIQEDAKLVGNKLQIENKDIIKESNIRRKGSQIKKGECAIPKGTKLTPPLIGFLASMGIRSVNVHKKPKISIIVTGTELITADQERTVGKIYESNGITLKTALRSIGITDISLFHVNDDENELKNTLKKALDNSDIILLTGGISVGKYDFTYSAMKQLEIKELFYKVKQKPGKPLFFGKKENTAIFGLPGNPAAVITCFYNYVFQAINIYSGNNSIFLKSLQLKTASDYKKKIGLTTFLKANINNNKVIIHEGQESNILSSYLNSDCMVSLPEQTEEIYKNDLVEILLFPNN
ncbi:MAG: molybdopterin molybdotransferase MoeA [Bacteroidia bacterium]|nr:molybdopterin molybdotransferase MoeA [Bacteroidia bacterium]